MFSEDELVIPSNSGQSQDSSDLPTPEPDNKMKKIMLIAALVLSVIAFIVVMVIVVNKYRDKKLPPIPVTEEPIKEEEQNTGNLPTGVDVSSDDPFSNGDLTETSIEYLTFSDFYEYPVDNIDIRLDDYELPLNIKIDGMNYYDLSRKINLDSVVDNLNNQGFAILENPWRNEVNDFYSIYGRLEERQIPFLITSDFMIYYHQNMLKKIYKDIEEHIFYDNLWVINKKLYDVSKQRYEARLAALGSVNDAILEGQRMELAFFAVALELLKPATNQIASKGALEDQTKFSEGDAERFNINLPGYLRDDVLREVQLIRAARDTGKSPNLLYVRNYTDFAVPKEYRTYAKLTNFYVAAKWLNSPFPVEYKNTACPDCLLDQEDWRLSMIAASYIATDIASQPELKSRWARIYKLKGFFSGLREEIDYVDYRDALVELFGDNYDIDDIFSDRNSEGMNNLEKLKTKITALDFPEIRGALDKNDKEVKKSIGFKVLADSYWPNDYIFGRLSWPNVKEYTGPDSKLSQLTLCNYNRALVRCNGFSLDVANLITPMAGNTIFDNNVQYLNYQTEANKLLQQFNRDGLWYTSNYWSTLSMMKYVLAPKPEEQPVFARSTAWQEKNIRTSVASWVNLQLPLEKISLAPIFKGSSLSDFSRYNENIYVEPNLALVNELIAINKMLGQMFTALRLNDQLSLASQSIQAIENDLQMIKNTITKELAGESLNEKDREMLTDFARKYVVDEKQSESDKTLILPFPKYRVNLKQNISRLKLMAVVHQSGDNKVISVGPIWENVESR